MGQLAHVLVHLATRVVFEEGQGALPAWIEGEPGDDGPEPTGRQQFACVLFLPLGTEDSSQPRTRKVTRPTVLWEPEDVLGEELTPPGPDDELFISAPELAGHFEQAEGWPEGTGRWQIEGRPQPFGRPGSVIGVQATLKQVER